jgi:hypothetical protein
VDEAPVPGAKVAAAGEELDVPVAAIVLIDLDILVRDVPADVLEIAFLFGRVDLDSDVAAAEGRAAVAGQAGKRLHANPPFRCLCG